MVSTVLCYNESDNACPKRQTMTKKEILKSKNKNRELDVLAAERILGWSDIGQLEEWIKDESGKYTPLEATDDDWFGCPTSDTISWADLYREVQEEKRKATFERLPYFCTNTDDAKLLTDKLAEKGIVINTENLSCLEIVQKCLIEM